LLAFIAELTGGLIDMKTYLLVWNPAKWTFKDWPQALRDMEQIGFYVREWSCISKKPIEGDAVLLKKTGKGLTGIIASGVVLSKPYVNHHWAKNQETKQKQYVHVRFERLADYTKGEILPVNDKADFGFIPQASGCVLDDAKAESLMRRFRDYVSAPIIAARDTVPSTVKRVGISVRTRYEVLDRDAHTCHYCGRSAPVVSLHVDHIISQAIWRQKYGELMTSQTIDGKTYVNVNDRNNLITSCADCNLGKSSRTGHPPHLRG
jgi:hypothetical protein